MKTIQNNPNSTYKEILNEIFAKADLENKEILFIEIYDYLEKINKKELMPFLLKDLKKLGLEIIFSRVYTDYKDLTVSK
jgi:hypothetical protein